jgi:hypothetical protein
MPFLPERILLTLAKHISVTMTDSNRRADHAPCGSLGGLLRHSLEFRVFVVDRHIVQFPMHDMVDENVEEAVLAFNGRHWALSGLV